MTPRQALEAISRIAGNLPDDSITSKTGANDAVQRGLMVVNAREIARQALAEMDIKYERTANLDGMGDCPFGEARINVSLPENKSILFVFTHEGLITDIFEDGDNVGTSSIMYDERYEQLLPKNVHKVIGRLQDEFSGRDGSLLDEIVHDCQVANASAVNNEGIEQQIAEIIQSEGEERGERLIREALGIVFDRGTRNPSETSEGISSERHSVMEGVSEAEAMKVIQNAENSKFSSFGYELSGGYISYPDDDDGTIRRVDDDGNTVEVRTVDDEGYKDWADLFKDHKL